MFCLTESFLIIYHMYQFLHATHQGYSTGGPRSESGPLDVEVRTSSASQSCILYAEVFIPKSSDVTSASEPLTHC